jgi:hypothetical protein
VTGRIGDHAVGGNDGVAFDAQHHGRIAGSRPASMWAVRP